MIELAKQDPLHGFVRLDMHVIGAIFIFLAGGLMTIGSINAR